jgi:hypothetical protein
MVIRSGWWKALRLLEDGDMVLEKPVEHGPLGVGGRDRRSRPRCTQARVARHTTWRPSRWKTSIRASKSQVMGPNMHRKSTPRTKSKQPRSMPTHVMVSSAPAIETSMPRAIPAHGKRSPLATVTQSWSPVTPRGRGAVKCPLDEVMHRAGVQEGEQAFALDRDVDHHVVRRSQPRACRETTKALAVTSRSVDVSSPVSSGSGGVIVRVVARLKVEQTLALMTADEGLITFIAQPLTMLLTLFCWCEVAKLTNRMLHCQLLCAWKGSAGWWWHRRW